MRGPIGRWTLGTECCQSCWHAPPITSRSPWPMSNDRLRPPSPRFGCGRRRNGRRLADADDGDRGVPRRAWRTGRRARPRSPRPCGTSCTRSSRSGSRTDRSARGGLRRAPGAARARPDASRHHDVSRGSGSVRSYIVTTRWCHSTSLDQGVEDVVGTGEPTAERRRPTSRRRARSVPAPRTTRRSPAHRRRRASLPEHMFESSGGVAITSRGGGSSASSSCTAGRRCSGRAWPACVAPSGGGRTCRSRVLPW